MKTRYSIPLFALALALGACQKADEVKANTNDETTTAAKPVDDPGATPVAKPGASRPTDEKGHECGGSCGDDCEHHAAAAKEEGGCGGGCNDHAAAAKEEGGCGGGCNHGKGEAGEQGEEGHSCGGDTTRLTNDELVERTDDNGRKVLHAGQDFTATQLVSVAELLSKPDDYVGKVVQVEGDISAMCHHKRGWMAVVAEDKSGRALRVMTAPTFLVPAESIGKTARAEGKIDVIEVPREMAKHLASEHKLDEPQEKDGKVQQVVMHATGADFI